MCASKGKCKMYMCPNLEKPPLVCMYDYHPSVRPSQFLPTHIYIYFIDSSLLFFSSVRGPHTKLELDPPYRIPFHQTNPVHSRCLALGVRHRVLTQCGIFKQLCMGGMNPQPAEPVGHLHSGPRERSTFRLFV